MKFKFLVHVMLFVFFCNCKNDWEYQEPHLLPNNCVLKNNFKSTLSSIDILCYDVICKDNDEELKEYPRNVLNEYGWKNTSWDNISKKDSSNIKIILNDILNDVSLNLNLNEKKILTKLVKEIEINYKDYLFSEFYKGASLKEDNLSFHWRIFSFYNSKSKKLYLLYEGEH